VKDLTVIKNLLSDAPQPLIFLYTLLFDGGFEKINGVLINKNKFMEAAQFLTEKSDWFDKSPGGEKLYFESEVIRMMNDYANEALRIQSISGRSELLLAFANELNETAGFPLNSEGFEEFVSEFLSKQ